MNFLLLLKAVFTGKVDDKSQPGKLDLTDTAKLTRDALVVGGAAALTYAVDNLGDLKLGGYEAALVPIIALLLNAGIKYLKNNK